MSYRDQCWRSRNDDAANHCWEKKMSEFGLPSGMKKAGPICLLPKQFGIPFLHHSHGDCHAGLFVCHRKGMSRQMIIERIENQTAIDKIVREEEEEEEEEEGMGKRNRTQVYVKANHVLVVKQWLYRSRWEQEDRADALHDSTAVTGINMTKKNKVSSSYPFTSHSNNLSSMSILTSTQQDDHNTNTTFNESLGRRFKHYYLSFYWMNAHQQLIPILLSHNHTLSTHTLWDGGNYLYQQDMDHLILQILHALEVNKSQMILIDERYLPRALLLQDQENATIVVEY
jgi:hypothetical protein